MAAVVYVWVGREARRDYLGPGLRCAAQLHKYEVSEPDGMGAGPEGAIACLGHGLLGSVVWAGAAVGFLCAISLRESPDAHPGAEGVTFDASREGRRRGRWWRRGASRWTF